MGKFLWIIKYVIIVLIHLQIGLTFAGDDPCSATELDPSSSVYDNYSNIGNSDSGVEAPPYGGYAGSDIWFSFIMPSSGFVNLIIEGGTLIDPALGIYEGPCDNPKLIYNIIDNNCDGSVNPAAVMDALTPGEEYFIRIWAQDGSGDGDFDVFLSETAEVQPVFLLYADAEENGDCIDLTTEVDFQHGCAWFEIPVDFTQPFTHDMTANFGNLDFTGADGICLVYQSNGPDYCGAAGGGMGALNMPNSAIFEFDTYQNFNYGDPFNDHTAFGINGDINHSNSISGPVDLGNIEDGQDHTISFVYDGSGGYELYFDGVLMYSGVYDFINNCFGGSTTAWWGYTAATGGANNLQTICPITEDIELGTQEYLEVEICEGDTYNGYMEDGFYVDFEAGNGNCQHQINTRLIVHPSPEPTLLVEYICEGEVFEIEGEYFEEEGNYEVYAFTDFGCDSLINLELHVPEIELEIIVPEPLSCNNSSTNLTLFFDANYPVDYVNFIWDTPTGSSSSNNYTATEPGLYTVTAFVYFENLLCIVEAYNYLEADTLSPEIIPLDDYFLDCISIDSITTIKATAFGADLSYLWYYQNEMLSESDTVDIIGAGTYLLTVTNNVNGCTNSDSSIVIMTMDIPTIELNTDTLDCETTSFNVNTVLSGEIDSIVWTYDGAFFSNDISPSIESPGSYEITVISSTGCEASQTLSVVKDTLFPSVMAQDVIIPCDETEIQLSVEIDSGTVLTWLGPQLIPENELAPVVSHEGTYYITVRNPQNQCISTDSITVKALGTSPQISIVADTINCYHDYATIKLSCNQSDVSYSWSNGSMNIGNSVDLVVFMEGVYFVTVSSSEGCSSQDTVEIFKNIAHPDIFLQADSLDCKAPKATVAAVVDGGDLLEWTGPDGSSHTSLIFETALPGLYHLLVTNQINGCKTVDSIEVTDVSNPPEFELFSDTITCNRPTVELDLQLFSAIEFVEWLYPNGSQSNEVRPTADEPGTYSLHIEVSGDCDLDTMLTIEEDLSIPEVAYFSGIIDCNTPDAIIDVTIVGEYDRIDILTPDGRLFDTTYILSNQMGIHSVYVTGTNGCVNAFEVNIPSFLAPPQLELFGNDIDCIVENALLTFSTNEDLADFYWFYSANVFYFEEEIAVSEGGWYFLEIENLHGCTTLDSIFINKNDEYPEVVLLSENPRVVEVYAKEEVPIFIDVNSSVDYAIQWEPAEGLSCGNCLDPVILSKEIDRYRVEITNIYGCKDELSVDVRFEENIIVSIPNVFSPRNNDNLNDFFTLFSNEGIKTIDRMMIFDRWGELIFMKNSFPPNIPELGWDGRLNGRATTRGVYVYYFEVTSAGGERLIYTGDITLL